MRKNKTVWGCIIISLIIGILIGYNIGFTATLNWGVNKAIHFLSLKGIEIDIEKEELIYAISQYRNHINVCYPDYKKYISNASLYNNTRN